MAVGVGVTDPPRAYVRVLFEPAAQGTCPQVTLIAIVLDVCPLFSVKGPALKSCFWLAWSVATMAR